MEAKFCENVVILLIFVRGYKTVRSTIVRSVSEHLGFMDYPKYDSRVCTDALGICTAVDLVKCKNCDSFECCYQFAQNFGSLRKYCQLLRKWTIILAKEEIKHFS